ncbi:hypothetical protein BH20ACT2_BH20ACT2_03070 [soil metagenome]
MLGANRGRSWDPVLQRDCDFAGGFMIGLADHGFGTQLSDRAFEHVGLTGSSFVFADPERDLVAAVLVNGLNTSTDDAELLRRRFIRAILADVEASMIT